MTHHQLGRWNIRFFAFNWILLLCVMCSYLAVIPHFHGITFINTRGIVAAWVFFILAMMGQMALFTFLGCFLVWISHFIFRNKWVVYSLGVLIASCIVLGLSIDAVVYHLYHLHLAGLVWQIFRSGFIDEVIALSWMEWLALFLMILILLLIEIFLAYCATRYVKKREHLPYGLIIVVCGLGLLTGAYGMFNDVLKASHKNPIAWSNNHLIVIEAQFIPYFENGFALFLPHRGLTRLELADAGVYIQAPRVSKPLNYPLHPMMCSAEKKPRYNILFIILDAWRSDKLTPTVTPNLYAFAQNAWQFTNNDSGGDCTRPGIFSLFYSLPENYWDAVLEQKKGPVFIHQLLADGYQMGIYRSASLHFPAFDQSVFREVPNLTIEQKGKTSADRDESITKGFLQFLKKRDPQKPFFGFLFYDESHNYCEEGTHYPKPFQPAAKECDRLGLTRHSNPIPMLNRYKNAVHFDDALAAQVLNELKNQDLLKNTIVIITADHGEEFNDNGLGYWGHASDYTPYQIHTPLAIYFPGETPQQFHYATTHYDVVPFLMNQVLGCTNPSSDYSVGAPLLQAGNRPFFVVNSYVDYAVLTPENIMRIYPEGNYAVQNRNGFVLPNAKLNVPVMEQAERQLNRYFKK